MVQQSRNNQRPTVLENTNYPPAFSAPPYRTRNRRFFDVQRRVGLSFRFATNRQQPPCGDSNRHPQSLCPRRVIHARVLPLPTVPFAAFEARSIQALKPYQQASAHSGTRSVSQRLINAGSRYFCESFFGHPCPTSGKNYATANAFGGPSRPASFAGHPTRGAQHHSRNDSTRFRKACIFTTQKTLRENTCPIASGDYSTPCDKRSLSFLAR